MTTNTRARPRPGRRYTLVVYQSLIDRWWPITFVLGGTLLAIGWLLSQHPLGRAEPWRVAGMLAAGAGVLVFGLMLLVLRKMAYVQPFEGYLRVVTPFLRMNISFKRFKRTYTAEMGGLFPPNKARGTLREIIHSVSNWSAIVVEVNELPFSRRFLSFFLSPLFFADKTPHLVILVRDWMKFSTEMESLRTPGASRPRPQAPVITSGLISNIKKDGKR